MEHLFIKECERLMIDFAKEKNLSPEQTLDNFQSALLNIAGWFCECYNYPNDKYEAYMKDYAERVVQTVERQLRKE